MFIGGTRDGERYEVDAMTIEMVRKVAAGPWTSDSEPPRETKFFENYCRHRVMVGDYTCFVYALDMTDAEAAGALISGYAKGLPRDAPIEPELSGGAS